MSGSEWYSDGLRFSCTQCGNCCTGPPGVVWFDEAEGKAIAALLGIPEPQFYEQYARRVDGRWSLEENHTEHGFDCIFLKREGGRAGCSVYEARPAQCRTWPFWPEMLQSKRAWITAKKRTPCPGMDAGRLVPLQQIRIQRDATPAD